MLDEYGADYSDKPVSRLEDSALESEYMALWALQNDFLMWAIEGAKGEEKTPLRLTNRILGLNFAAIHTSSMVRICLYPILIWLIFRFLRCIIDVHSCRL